MNRSHPDFFIHKVIDGYIHIRLFALFLFYLYARKAWDQTETGMVYLKEFLFFLFPCVQIVFGS